MTDLISSSRQKQALKPCFFLLLFVSLLFSCKKKNASVERISSDCEKPSNLNFRTLVFRDQAGSKYWNSDSPTTNDMGDDWTTDQPIPCYFFAQMDTNHVVVDDSSTVPDSVYTIYSYPNPTQGSNFYLSVLARKPMLMHLLFVGEDGIAYHKENIFIGSANFRNEGIDPGEIKKGYYAYKLIQADSLSQIKLDRYYRLFYYFSTKYNRRFGEGHADMYIGQNYPGN